MTAFVTLALALVAACATPEREHWETAKQACKGHGGAISIDMDKGLCFCFDGLVCELE